MRSVDDVIVIASVQNTGTWFAIDVVRNHPRVSYFKEIEHLISENDRLVDLYHKCSASDEVEPELLGEFRAALVGALPECGDVALHHHIFRFHWSTVKSCWVNWKNIFGRAFDGFFKTIVPVRDPLLSLITGYTRSIRTNDPFDFEDRIGDFELIIDRSWAAGDKFFLLPVDQMLDEESRFGLLSSLLNFVGLPRDDYIKRVSKMWFPVNSIGEYDLKTWYFERDLSRIEDVIPGAVEVLRKREYILRPFLESLGYKNLLWWK
jgi:hypothetical protein